MKYFKGKMYGDDHYFFMDENTPDYPMSFLGGFRIDRTKEENEDYPTVNGYPRIPSMFTAVGFMEYAKTKGYVQITEEEFISDMLMKELTGE